LQYLMLGSGEGRQVMGQNQRVHAFQAKTSFDVFTRQPKQQRRQGLWSRM